MLQNKQTYTGYSYLLRRKTKESSEKLLKLVIRVWLCLARHKSNIEKSKVFLNNSKNQVKNITERKKLHSRQEQNLQIRNKAKIEMFR